MMELFLMMYLNISGINCGILLWGLTIIAISDDMEYTKKTKLKK